MYTQVIVGTDGSDRPARAEPTAAHAAQALGCTVEPVHVPSADDPPDLVLPPDVRVLPAGDPAERLIEHVRSTDPPGLLCMASRGRRALGEVVFGSVTAQVLRGLHAPMLTVGPATRPLAGPWRRMLVALDGSDNAASILPVASGWARALDLELNLRHVVYPLGDPRLGDFQVHEEDQAAVAQMRAAARQLRAEGLEVTWSVQEHPKPAEGLVEVAAHRHADLIALATHGRTGLARLVAGSVALDLVRRATVPVLTLRPEHLR